MSTVLFDNPWDVEGKIEEENVRMKNRHGRLIKRGPCGGKTEETNGTQPLCVRTRLSQASWILLKCEAQ